MIGPKLWLISLILHLYKFHLNLGISNLVQFSIIYMVPAHNKSHLKAISKMSLWINSGQNILRISFFVMKQLRSWLDCTLGYWMNLLWFLFFASIYTFNIKPSKMLFLQWWWIVSINTLPNLSWLFFLISTTQNLFHFKSHSFDIYLWLLERDSQWFHSEVEPDGYIMTSHWDLRKLAASWLAIHDENKRRRKKGLWELVKIY